LSKVPYAQLVSNDVRERIGQITLTTATDGNHGRGVAWAAERLGQKAVVYMPKGSAPSRMAAIGLMDLLANHTDFEALKDDLEIGPDSTLLCFNTEGATDPVNYQEIIWHGKYPSIV
jgi:hypothetical protein